MFGPRVRPVALVLLLVPSSFAASATHVVSGVAASRPYHVSVNGTNAGTATSDATGVLALAGVGPGVVHLTSAAGADVIPPAPITDLALTGEAPAGLELRFRAVGDDGILGRASAYELRWASGYSGMLLAPLVEVLPLTPSPAGTEEVLLVPDPMPGRLLLLGLRVRDDAGNWSAPSNVVVRAADGEGRPPRTRSRPRPSRTSRSTAWSRGRFVSPGRRPATTERRARRTTWSSAGREACPDCCSRPTWSRTHLRRRPPGPTRRSS